jgi:hypothetical protein
VTSWHVFSGVNPNTREVKGTPNRVRCHINVVDQLGTRGRFIVRPVDLLLTINDDPVWWQHPSEEVVDIAVLRLNDQITYCEEIKIEFAVCHQLWSL